jgi:membrane dipeptidase
MHERRRHVRETRPIPVFDGHNDATQKLAPFDDLDLRRFLDGRPDGHIDLLRARRGGLGGGMFAAFVPSDPGLDTPDNPRFRITGDGYEVRLASPVAHEVALHGALRQIDAMTRLAAGSAGAIRLVRTADALDTCMRSGVLAIVAHLEGAEPIDPDLGNLETLYELGVRSVGITWSRPNAFGHGVPFRFPASPDTGPGLTAAGKALVRRCNALGILIDVSHLNEAGFWDVVDVSTASIVATHSAAHAICPVTRNLTDAQLGAIRDSDGLVGVNFEVSATRPDSYDDPDTPIDVLVAQVDYLVERLGIDRVALGSDFDGATMPMAIGDASGLPVLIGALGRRGYDRGSLEKLAWRNWSRVLHATWR